MYLEQILMSYFEEYDFLKWISKVKNVLFDSENNCIHNRRSRKQLLAAFQLHRLFLWGLLCGKL